MAQVLRGTMSPAPGRCRLRPEEAITLLCGTSRVVCVPAKSSAQLDRVALCALQLLLDLDDSSIRIVWILPPLEVDPVRKDRVGIKDKVDGVVVFRFEVTGTILRDEVLVRRKDNYRYDRLSYSSGERCTPCSTPSQQSLEASRPLAKVEQQMIRLSAPDPPILCPDPSDLPSHSTPTRTL